MKLVQAFLTKNPRYTNPKKIDPKGLMLHSVGCPQPSASVFIKLWNKASQRLAVHGFIDANDGTVYQTLPWNYRGVHGGGSSNNTHIGVEMCEPSCIKYTTGANFTCSDKTKARVAAKRTYDAAVELFAMLCKEYSLDPLTDIVSHSEGHKLGIASGHADPEHLWKGLGMNYTMDTFRKAVKAAVSGVSSDSQTTSTTSGNVLYRVQVGAYTVKKNAEAQLAKVKAAGFNDAFIAVVDGKLYRVQVGAFSVKANAEAMLAKVKAAGFSAFITKNGGTVATAKKSVTEIAKEVIAGKWSNGAERKQKLIAAGYDPNEVQAEVNRLLK